MLRKLNWNGWIITMFLIMLAAAINDNVKTIFDWTFIVLVFGVPFSLFPLIAGRID